MNGEGFFKYISLGHTSPSLLNNTFFTKAPVSATYFFTMHYCVKVACIV